ncbi:hypothetical protein ACLOJK_023383 [Asimina triloba]
MSCCCWGSVMEIRHWKRAEISPDRKGDTVVVQSAAGREDGFCRSQSWLPWPIVIVESGTGTAELPLLLVKRLLPETMDGIEEDATARRLR